MTDTASAIDEALDELAAAYVDVVRRNNSGSLPKSEQAAIAVARRLLVRRVVARSDIYGGGYYEALTSTIYYDPKQPPEEVVLTIIHETLECLARRDMPGLVPEGLRDAVGPARRTEVSWHEIAERGTELARREMHWEKSSPSAILHVARPPQECLRAKYMTPRPDVIAADEDDEPPAIGRRPGRKRP